MLPVIPSQGSVGASGDLAPLAHLAQVVIGEGQARLKGETLPGAEALRRAGISPIALEAKEGLSLLNGTQGMLALVSLALREGEILADTADIAAALSLDALRGSPNAFDSRITAARPFAGAVTTARNLSRLIEGSQIRESHRAAAKDPRVQDAYIAPLRKLNSTAPPTIRSSLCVTRNPARATFSAEEIFTGSRWPWPPTRSP